MVSARKPVLPVASVLKKAQRYTFADYYSWDDDQRWELIGSI